MPGGDWRRKTQVSRGRRYTGGRGRMFGEIPMNNKNRLVARAFYPQAPRSQADTFRGAIDEPLLLMFTKAIKRELQRGGAAVDTQDDLSHAAGHFSSETLSPSVEPPRQVDGC